jgi:hypothetical protein
MTLTIVPEILIPQLYVKQQICIFVQNFALRSVIIINMYIENIASLKIGLENHMKFNGHSHLS